MTISEYFANTSGHGVLATANDKGKADLCASIASVIGASIPLLPYLFTRPLSRLRFHR
jgi:hypothetical protein